MNKSVLAVCCSLFACQQTVNVDNCVVGNPCGPNLVCDTAITEMCVPSTFALNSIAPGGVDQSQGGSVTINGTGFKPGIIVKINGTQVNNPTLTGTTTIMVQVPADPSVCGAVDVQLINPDGSMVDRSDLLHYTTSAMPNLRNMPVTTTAGIISSTVSQIVIADLNGDSYDEVLLREPHSGGGWSIVLYQGMPGGALSYVNTVSFNVTSMGSVLRVHDLNGDDKPDIVLIPTGTTVQSIGAAVNTGPLNGFSAGQYGLPGTGGYVFTDAVFAPSSWTASGLLSTASVLFTVPLPVTGSQVGSASPVYLGGLRNLVFGQVENSASTPQLLGLGMNSTVLVLDQGNPFSAKAPVQMPTGTSSFRVGDIDQDGNQDLVSGIDNTLGLSYTPGKGDGTFGSIVALGSPQVTAVEYELGDYSCDGFPGVVYVPSATPGALYYLKKGGPTGAFGGGIPILSSAGGNISAFALKDLNGDGRPDVVYTTASGNLFVAFSS